jgi:hypothetical protein
LGVKICFEIFGITSQYLPDKELIKKLPLSAAVFLFFYPELFINLNNPLNHNALAENRFVNPIFCIAFIFG